MKCKTPNEVLLVDAINAILHDLPYLYCVDFHHAKKDRHENGMCPIEARFNDAVEYARKLVA